MLSLHSGLGEWERHTRGIGAKILERYGHVAGKGLGKSLQGISTPVEAFKRKGKAALGFYGTERTERSKQDFPVKQDEEEKEAEEFRAQMQQWKKGEVSGSRVFCAISVIIATPHPYPLQII